MTTRRKWLAGSNPKSERRRLETQALQREAREKRGNTAKARFRGSVAAPATSLLWRR